MKILRSASLIGLAIALSLTAIFAVPAGIVSTSGGRALAQDACDYPSETLQIMAPAAPGGGWDTTAREIQRVLGEGVVDQSVEVFNVEGAGGTIGLAQLVSDNGGDPHTLMVMGMVMIGAIGLNQADVGLDTVTPIARLTGEYEVIVVPADSEFQTLDDLIAAFQEDPGAISWAGGSAGGTDHILIGLIAQAVGVEPTAINYIPYSGGGEALAAILGGQVSAGVSGLGEWQDQIIAGELRALAISAPAAESGSGEMATPTAEELVIPTLQEQGVDVELANWRGIVAPPDLSEEQTACIVEMVQQMHDSEEWGATLETYGWQDLFMAGPDFADFLPGETERINGILQSLGLIE
ncbi:MAG: Bug family tripartite tricarboxylate transporter substrate binding protein [Thermomicrobiales bacterium]